MGVSLLLSPVHCASIGLRGRSAPDTVAMLSMGQQWSWMCWDAWRGKYLQACVGQ
jgi:hypothetical protein